MKWIKLFEQYTQKDKVEAVAMIWLVFTFQKSYKKINTIKDSNGDIFYYKLTKKGDHLEPKLMTFINHKGGGFVVWDFFFMYGMNKTWDALNSHETIKFSLLCLNAARIALNKAKGSDQIEFFRARPTTIKTKQRYKRLKELLATK